MFCIVAEGGHKRMRSEAGRCRAAVHNDHHHQEEVAMTTLARPGVPAGGFKTIGQVHATNDLVFTRKQNAMGIAVELLTTHTPGAPVVDGEGRFA